MEEIPEEMKKRIDAPDASPRRKRRKEKDIRQLILDAALREANRLGYAATTTRVIAQSAGVSESLVFRHFGSKAALFDLVVFGPFTDLLSHFIENHSMPEDTRTLALNSREFVSELLQYLRQNRRLIGGFLQNASSRLEETEFPPASTLENYFALSQMTLEALHRKTTGYADANVGLAMRLSFAAVLGSVLFSDWLFPGNEPDIETLTDGLVRLLVRAQGPENPA